MRRAPCDAARLRRGGPAGGPTGCRGAAAGHSASRTSLLPGRSSEDLRGNASVCARRAGTGLGSIPIPYLDGLADDTHAPTSVPYS